MEPTWPDRQTILDMSAEFQRACVLGAAAELDIFTTLEDDALTAEQLADRLESDPRATTMLLDAVAALRLLDKEADRYSVPPELQPILSDASAECILPMVRHRMNILRGWIRLAEIAKSGTLPPRQASIRGAEADRASFVAAMHTVSGPVADELIRNVVAGLGQTTFKHVLDVGGASGTWTLALLRALPGATATIFDLPDAIEQARARIAPTDMADRISFAEGDFYVDDLPTGADFAWVSAIVHQHSRRHNVELFAKVHAALMAGGTIAIRDVVMEPTKTRPYEGTMFAINMLANTETGTTFTFDELADDLQTAGFVEPKLLIRHEAMNSLVTATKPTY